MVLHFDWIDDDDDDDNINEDDDNDKVSFWIIDVDWCWAKEDCGWYSYNNIMHELKCCHKCTLLSWRKKKFFHNSILLFSIYYEKNSGSFISHLHSIEIDNLHTFRYSQKKRRKHWTWDLNVFFWQKVVFYMWSIYMCAPHCFRSYFRYLARGKSANNLQLYQINCLPTNYCWEPGSRTHECKLSCI